MATKKVQPTDTSKTAKNTDDTKDASGRKAGSAKRERKTNHYGFSDSRVEDEHRSGGLVAPDQFRRNNMTNADPAPAATAASGAAVAVGGDVADTTAFRTDGFFVAHSVFTTSECDEIVEQLKRASSFPIGDENDGPLVMQSMTHVTSEQLTRFATDRRWASIVLPLLGTGDARLYWDQAVTKPGAARTEFPWHQDNGQLPLVPGEYISCWLALDDSDRDNGCIWVIPGSHREGTRRHRRRHGPLHTGYEGDDAGIAIPVRRGDVLVLSSLLLHRSGPNTTDLQRRAWLTQYCPAHATLDGDDLDDRLLVASEGAWLNEPLRERTFELVGDLACLPDVIDGNG